MESNNNNNELREELTELQNKVTLISEHTKDEIEKLLCQIYQCGDDKKPILVDGKLPNPSRIGQLEKKVQELEEMWNEDSDDDSDDSDDIKKEMEEEENRLKELEEGLEEVRVLSRRRGTDIEANETRNWANRARIVNLENWRRGLGDAGFDPPVDDDDNNVGPGGGKRRKRTSGKLRAKSRAKSRKKRRRKRRKSRRKSKGRKRRRKNLKKRTKRRR